MAAINEFYLTADANRAVNMEVARSGPLSDAARALISQAAWHWFVLNRDLRVVTIKWWFIRKTVYLRDLEDVWEMIFGPKPSAT